MNSAQSNRIQRILALLTIGICDALQSDAISIDEAENLLFSPRSVQFCEQIGASAKIIDVVNEGTELDAINRLVSPDQLTKSTKSMIALACAFLRETEPSDNQLDNWIDQMT